MPASISAAAEEAAVDLHRLEQNLVRAAKTLLFAPQPDPRLQVDRAGYVLMARLQVWGEVRASDLAGELQLDQSTVSRQVRLLTGLGLVDRRPDPDDRRASLLTLTPGGRAELQKQVRARQRLLQGVLKEWEEVDRQRLVDLVARLAEELAPSPSPCSQTRSSQTRSSQTRTREVPTP